MTPERARGMSFNLKAAEYMHELEQQLAALEARNKLLETLLGTFRAMIDSAQQEGEE